MVIKKNTIKKETSVSEPTVISVSRKFTFPPDGAGEYESVSIQASVTAGDYETASSKLEEVMLSEAERASTQFNEIVLSARSVAEDLETDDGEAEEAGTDDSDEDGVSEEQVRAMKRSELIALIKEYDLSTDPDDHKGDIKGLREAIIAEAFTEDGEEAVEEEEETEEGEEEEAGEEEETLDPDEVLAMKRPELLKLAKEYGVEVDASDYSKNEKGRKNLAEDLLKALTEEGDEEEEAEEAEEDGEDEGTGEDEAYTEEDLKDMGTDDLKEIYKEWELGKFPTGAPKVVKTKAIKAILAAQVA